MNNHNQGAASNFPRMDWAQVALNTNSLVPLNDEVGPCFWVDVSRNIFCGRAKRWQGHGAAHEFVTLAAYFEKWDRFATLETKLAYQTGVREGRSMNKTITQRIRELAEAHPIECPEWQKLQDLMVDAEREEVEKSKGEPEDRRRRCPKCGEAATYQTPDGVFWDSNAHYWKEPGRRAR